MTCDHREGSLIRCPACLGPTTRLSQWTYACDGDLDECSVIEFTVEVAIGKRLANLGVRE